MRDHQLSKVAPRLVMVVHGLLIHDYRASIDDRRLLMVIHRRSMNDHR